MVKRLLPEMQKRNIQVFGGTACFVLVATSEIESGQFQVEAEAPPPDPTWWETFLDWLRRGRTVLTAADLAGVTPPDGLPPPQSQP